jgi:NAD(P)-dependent dehydrogenase (short-subunit alcohol dehydrogenase family)
VAALFDDAGGRFSAPDLVFNNAGIQGDIAPLADYSLGDVRGCASWLRRS